MQELVSEWRTMSFLRLRQRQKLSALAVERFWAQFTRLDAGSGFGLVHRRPGSCFVACDRGMR